MKLKTEHSGAKHGGGYWGKREEAKRRSTKARRVVDKATAIPEPEEGSRLPTALVYAACPEQAIVQEPLAQLPIGVAGWETKLVERLPKALKGSLPTVEEIEAGLEGELRRGTAIEIAAKPKERGHGG